MLILKNPLTLQSISAFGIFSDSLGEKICGNYQTFGAAVTGEDLIHMTVQKPDIYVGIRNDGPFLVDNQIQVDNQVRLELVNRLVNRLMLYSSPQFTYQDEVFVAAVLQKLGIADVNEFMQQVKLHMEQNELAVALINRYFDEGREFAYTVNQLLENIISDRQEQELIKNEYWSDHYLHNDIFRRLMTAECSNTVYSYQNPVQVKERTAGSFQAIEWMRQADRIQLSQLRENIYWQTDPAVFCSYSNYETKPLTVKELTRQKVIGRMSAAILENIVNVAGYALQYEYGSTNVWKDYSRIFYGSSENVLERFHYFQEHGGIGDVQLKAYTVRMNELVQDELHLTQLLEFADRSDYLSEEDTLYEDMRQNIVLTMLENQNLQKQLVTEFQAAQTDLYSYQEERNQYINERNRFEAAYRILRQKKNANYFAMVTQEQFLNKNLDGLETERTLKFMTSPERENAMREHTGGIKKEIGINNENVVQKENDTDNQLIHMQTLERGQAVYELTHRSVESGESSDMPLTENMELLPVDTLERTLNENADGLETDRAIMLLTAISEQNVLHKRIDSIKREIGGKLQKTAERANDTGHQPERAHTPESGQAVYELIHRYAESAADSDVPLMENIELLEQINQHNLYMKQLLDSKGEAADPPKRIVVDRAQAREAALRALDHPEQVLQEIYENTAGERKIPRELVNQIPGEIERILSVTDENTRSYYERLMGYSSDGIAVTEPESGEKYEDRFVMTEQAGQETDARNLFLETVESVLHTTCSDTQGSDRQGEKYPAADTAHPQEYTDVGETVLTQKEQTRREEIQQKIYWLLRWIDRRERVYRTNTVIQAQELQEQLQNIQLQKQMVDIQHRSGLLNIKEIVSLEHPDIIHRQVVSASQNIEKNVQMVHKTREQTNQEVVDEVLETIENSSLLRQTIEKNNEETQLAKHQIEQIRNELITQSREQLTYMVERSMKTHVHELSDMVYLELERRLKNEQRRRGY